MTPQQKKQLKTQAHHLNVTVTVGQAGITQAIDDEIAQCLKTHELLKIKHPAGGDAAQKKAWADSICKTHKATLIQKIGRTLTIYRKKIPTN
jgi:RNA-binding protein